MRHFKGTLGVACLLFTQKQPEHDEACSGCLLAWGFAKVSGYLKENPYTRVKRVFGGYGGYEWLKPLPDGRFRITTTTNFGGYVVVMVVMQFLNNSTPYLGGNKSH